MPEASACRACGEPGIETHWRVAGDAGPDGLVPTTDRYGIALADIGRCPACVHMQLVLDVRTSALLDAELPEAHFDAVFLGDVIEHLPEPGEALERLGGLLTPGGLLVLALPDAGGVVARAMGRRWWSVIPTPTSTTSPAVASASCSTGRGSRSSP